MQSQDRSRDLRSKGTNNSLPYETPRLPGIGERAFTVLILLLSTGAFMCLVTVPGQASDEPGIAGKLVAGSIYLIICLLLARHCGFWRTIWRGRWVIALASVAILSTLWSEDPSISLRKGVSVGATALVGLYFASRYSMGEQIRLLARMCAITMVCSLVFGLLGLGQSIDGAVGWYGIYVQKNQLGKMAVMSALVFWSLTKTDARGRWAGRVGILLSLTLLYLSNSMTAVIVLPLLFGLEILLRAFRRSRRLGVALFGFGAVLGVAVLRWGLMNMQSAAGAVGRDLSLTGRVQVWIYSTFMALQRPWLGYGYYAFWEGFVTYVRRAISFLDWNYPDSSWPLMYLAFIFLYNLTESTLLVPNSIFWVLYAATAFSVSAESESSFVRIPVGERQIAYRR
jgi:exopolysaccharide production protein ExoQ